MRACCLPGSACRARCARSARGNYEIPPGTTPIALLDKLVRGEESLRSLTLVEGWTFRQMRAALAREELRHDTASLSDAEIMQQLGRPGVPAEGRFFPDTYAYAKGSSDLAVLRRALHAMDRHLEAAWRSAVPTRRSRAPMRHWSWPALSKRKPARRPTGRRSPGCLPTACAPACCCRPTRP
jgi:cell division protein YceG involved in septum cleavage